MILFFDTETTGVPKNYQGSITDLDNWPRVIQLAWALYNNDGSLFDSACDLIKPDGWEVPKEDFWIKNGFTTEKSQLEGKAIHDVLFQFMTPLNRCKVMVAHNLSFDYPIVGAEMIRAGLRAQNKPDKFCTMKASTDICRIPGARGYKWPKLEELHRFLFQCDFDGAHDAMNDVMATAKCYFEMQKRGMLTPKVKPAPLNINANEL